MNVFILDAEPDMFRGVYVAREYDCLEFSRRFNGTPMKKSWNDKEPFAYVPVLYPKSDTPSFEGGIPVFNTKAVRALADFLEPNGELLPVMCDGEQLFVYNVTRLIDALDEGNSRLSRFSDGGIIDIERHSFFLDKLMGERLFKLSQDPLGNVYVTDHFLGRVKAAGLRGFYFPFVWSSD